MTAKETITNAIKNWWIPLLVGVLFIIFGIYIFTVPDETYAALSILFSVSFFVAGIFDIAFSLSNTKTMHGWGWYLVLGLMELVLGIYLMAYPDVSAGILPFVVAFMVMFRSFQMLGFALDLNGKGVSGSGWLIVSSILGIILSFLLLSAPGITGLSMVVFTALCFVIAGIAAISLSFNLKNLKE